MLFSKITFKHYYFVKKKFKNIIEQKLPKNVNYNKFRERKNFIIVFNIKVNWYIVIAANKNNVGSRMNVCSTTIFTLML